MFATDHLRITDKAWDRIKSEIPINVERINIVINTTPVDPINSSRVDQVTFCISARTSEKNFLILPHILNTPMNATPICRSGRN